MRKYNPMKIAGLLAAGAIWMGASTSANATLVSIDQIIYQSGGGVNGSLFSGTLDITSFGYTLTILMRNTSPDGAVVNGNLPSNMLLSGFGLQLPGVDILSGTVSVNGGSTALNFGSQSTSVMGNQYNYANSAIDGFTLTGVPIVDTVVSSVNNGQAIRFIGPPPPTIDGPDYGALSASESQFGTSQQGVLDTIQIILNLSGVAPSVASIDAGNVVLAFGSPTAVAPVPEPTTMIAGALLLLPFGASTLRILRRNRKS